jgi:DNA invertase Pin-like site-specific DNA recombinase
MSSGLKLDRADTVYAERAHELSLKNRNWLRHGIGTTADKIDEMLLDGATIEQMAKGAKTTKATVYMHLNHLRKVHKLAVVKKDGVFRYDMDRMNGKKIVGRKSRKAD